MPPSPVTRVNTDLTALIQSALDCETAAQYGQAYRLLEQSSALAKKSTVHDPAVLRTIQLGLWRLSPLWWAALEHDGVRFRRCQARDASFYQQCFENPVFTAQFNRQRPWQGDLGLALKKSGVLPPLQTRLSMWVVESRAQGVHKPIGLASLSSIDTQNLRAELAIGFPGAVPTSLGIKATLMMLHFALVMMPFNKVYAHVYEDNPQALHNATRLGFLHEGTLKDHFSLPGHGFVSVHLIGLTRAQLHASAYLRMLAQRKIGQAW